MPKSNNAHSYIPYGSKIPELYWNEEHGVDDPIIHIKLFTPWGSWTWYLTEYSDEAPDGYPRLAFGLVDGFEKEWGYVSIDEIREVVGPMGLRIERDVHWKPKPASEVA